MKSEKLNIILAGNNPNRCNNMASRLRYQGHKVDLISSGFQVLSEIEKKDTDYSIVFFLGDGLDEMMALEAISHIRVVKSQEKLFIIHVVDENSEVVHSIQEGANVVLADENFNKIVEALETAIKTIK